ncbi:hypothetical protein [Azospirillum himalayense]|uniref:Uncharacterized protein n=1 Tax=Azospirillum himalayense TaxID=654847 RepID=A0ABW0GD61_9PROT
MRNYPRPSCPAIPPSTTGRYWITFAITPGPLCGTKNRVAPEIISWITPTFFKSW